VLAHTRCPQFWCRCEHTSYAQHFPGKTYANAFSGWGQATTKRFDNLQTSSLSQQLQFQRGAPRGVETGAGVTPAAMEKAGTVALGKKGQGEVR